MRRRALLTGLAALLAAPAFGRALTGGPYVFSDPAFDAQLLAAANALRAAHGLRPFAPDPRLTRAALAQTQFMAEARVMAHEIPGQPDFPQRIRAAGARVRRAGENILRSNLSRHGAGCAQATPAAMAALSAELAQESMRRWIGSPPHLHSLLEPRFRRAGGAFTVVAAPDACGQMYIAQVFGG